MPLDVLPHFRLHRRPMGELRLLMRGRRMSLLLAMPGAKSLRNDGTAWPVATAWAANREQRRAEVRVVPLKIVQFLALVLTALALVPSGAHLFEFPGKINLGAEQYFIVQSIYRGWSLFGIVLVRGADRQSGARLAAARPRSAVRPRAIWIFLHCSHACHFLHLDLPGQSGDQQLDDDSKRLGAIAQALGVFARRQCRHHLRRILLSRPVLADGQGMNVDRRG